VFVLLILLHKNHPKILLLFETAKYFRLFFFQFIQLLHLPAIIATEIERPTQKKANPELGIWRKIATFA
jgi:hypothetical protein